jgi:anhydro-N-acetylmuramic acid kinase
VIVVSVASGTSVDALDVAAVELDWTEPDAVDLRVRGVGTVPWPDRLRTRVLALLAPATSSAEEWCRLDNEVGRLVASVAADAIEDLAGGRADLVVSPGQTVHHDVVDGRCDGTLQIGQPAWIVEATGLPVVSDLRSSDVAAGGHGAPLVSLFDTAWLSGPAELEKLSATIRPRTRIVADNSPRTEARAALNLGGIANVTVVGKPDQPVVGFDTGPANCLLDVAAHRVTDGTRTRDEDGRLAAAGRVRPDLLDRLLDHPYFRLDPPKSTGRETFSAALLDATLAELPPVDDADLLATLTELTARTVAAGLAPYAVAELLVSGGGVHNPALMAALRSALPEVAVVRSDERGVPVDAKEAVMWALLGFLTWHGVAGTAPGRGAAATGAAAPRPLGRISLSPAGPRPPQPRPDPLRRLTVRPAGVAA